MQLAIHPGILRYLPPLSAAVSAIFFLSTSAQAETIEEFKSQLTILPSGDVDVVEDIKIDFGEAGTRTQFYRVIPLWYEPSRSTPNQEAHRLDVDVKNVVMDNQESVPFRNWVTDRELQLTVESDQEQPFKKEHTFRIEYEMHKGVYFVAGQPILYLNVTGEQWPFPIERARISIVPPRGTDLLKVKSSGLIGVRGEYKEVGSTFVNEAIYFSVADIKPPESLTVVVSLPSGAVVSFSVLQDIIWYIRRFYQALALPLLTIMVLTTWWWFYGRDPAMDKGGAPPDWRPPDYLTPAEVGTLIDESCDLIDVSSTLFDLAQRGFVKIRVIPYNGFLYLGNKDYEFTLVRPANERDLKPHETLFLAAVFGLSSTTFISTIKGNFAEFLPLMKRRVYTSLVTESVFARDPEIDRKIFIAVGAAVCTIGLCLMIASSSHASGQSTALGTILSGLILIAAARAMPKRSTKGVAALAQIHRFKRTLSGENKEELEKIAKEDPVSFNKLLPYAIVLGIADQWARVFSESVKEYPDWYQIDPGLEPGDFSAVQFVADLGEGLSIINRALTEVDRAYLHSFSARELLRTRHPGAWRRG